MEQSLADLPKACTKTIKYRSFRGCRISASAKIEHYQSAAEYLPSPGDTFIVSYPKCGTTWLQHIVYLLKTGGIPANSIGEVVLAVPYLAQDGWPPVGTQILAYKYHLPLQLMAPLSEKARYIYVVRNPKDACVSYYHFLKNLPAYEFDSFDAFFDAFVAGELPYGDYFDHVADWATVRHRPNVLFVTYESLHRERERIVSDIADFIGIRLNTSTLRDVLHYSSFEFMRDLSRKDNFMEDYLRTNSSGAGTPQSDHKKPVMMRRGMVGDWRNHLSPQQSRTIDTLLEERVADMVDPWREVMGTGYSNGHIKRFYCKES